MFKGISRMFLCKRMVKSIYKMRSLAMHITVLCILFIIYYYARRDFLSLDCGNQGRVSNIVGQPSVAFWAHPCCKNLSNVRMM